MIDLDLHNFYVSNLSQEDLIKLYYELLSEAEDLDIKNESEWSPEEDELSDRLDTIWEAFTDESIKRVNETLDHISANNDQE